MKEGEVKALGFRLIKTYNHDHYHTLRYKKGCLQVEFTYDGEVLDSCELTISEVVGMPVTLKDLRGIVHFLNPILSAWEED